MMKNKKSKNFISLLLSASILFTAISTSAFGINEIYETSNKNFDKNSNSTLNSNKESTYLNKTINWIDNKSNIAEVKLPLSDISEPKGVDFVLVLDVSKSMIEKKDSQLISNANQLIDASGDFLDTIHNSSNKNMSDHRVGTVIFGSTGREILSMPGFHNYSNSENQKKAIKELVFADNTTDYESGLSTAKSLIDNRTDKSREAKIIFITDGEKNHGIESNNVKDLKSSNIDIYSIGLGLSNIKDIDCLKSISSNTDLNGNYTNDKFFSIANPSNPRELASIYEKIAKNSKAIGNQAVITDKIGRQFDLIQNHPTIKAVKPPIVTKTDLSGNVLEILPDKVELFGDTLKWNRESVTDDNIVLTYYVKLKNEFLLDSQFSSGVDESTFIEYFDYYSNKIKKYFKNPLLPSPGGQIELFTYLVDDNGQPISSNGDIISKSNIDSFAVKLFDSYNPLYYTQEDNRVFPFGISYTVDPISQLGEIISYSGKTYKIHKDSVTPKSFILEKNNSIQRYYIGYTATESVNYTVNYHLENDFNSEIIEIDNILSRNTKNNEFYSNGQLNGNDYVGENIDIQTPDINSLGYSYNVVGNSPEKIDLKQYSNEINVNYRKNTNTTPRYSINYVDEFGDPIVDLDGNIQINNIIGEGQIDSKKTVPQPKLKGYKIKPNQPLMMNITGNPSKDNIKVVYEKQLYNFTINYYEAGTKDKVLKSFKSKAQYGDRISISNMNTVLPEIKHKSKGITHMLTLEEELKEIYISPKSSKNILNVYYEPTSINVKIEYYKYRTKKKIAPDQLVLFVPPGTGFSKASNPTIILPKISKVNLVSKNTNFTVSSRNRTIKLYYK